MEREKKTLFEHQTKGAQRVHLKGGVFFMTPLTPQFFLWTDNFVVDIWMSGPFKEKDILSVMEDLSKDPGYGLSILRFM